MPAEQLQTHARRFIEAFIEKADTDRSYEIELCFYSTLAGFEADTGRVNAGPVYTKQQGAHFTIHICEDGLKDISSPALEGWMEYEAMRCIQKLSPERLGFNFKKHIYPLMPVTGLAENHIREMVVSLEAGIEKYLAAKALVHMGRGAQQGHFHFFRISPVAEDHLDYQRTQPHSWTKAIFLGRKFRELMPVYWLADQNVDFSQNLESYWWKIHAYLLPGDENFLKELAGIPLESPDTPYRDIVTALFKKLKSHYLRPPGAASEPLASPAILH